MIKLLIADDEEHIRDGLARMIDWNGMGITIVGCAADGLETYQMIVEHRPDVVLTDIKMPNMSGLELIERTVKENIAPIYVVVSGYSDFEFAQKAMRFGVMYYLLKPVSKEELEDVFKEIAGKFIDDDIDANDDERKILSIKYKNEIAKTIDYIDKNISNPSLSLGFIASDVLYMNSDYFGRVFRIVTGKYYTQFVMEKRIEKAKHLLKETDMKIYDIAEQVGFQNNVTYFGQVFKKYTGIQPTAFRGTKKQGENK